MTDERAFGGVPFCLVSGGPFFAGRGLEDVDLLDICPEERLTGSVEVEDFYISKTVLTVEDWCRYGGPGEVEQQDGTALIEWSKAHDWTARMSAEVGAYVRLVTEVEWEFAASNGGVDTTTVDRSVYGSRWGASGFCSGFEWCLDTYQASGIYPDSVIWAGRSANVDRLLPPAEGLPYLKAIRGSGAHDPIARPAIRTSGYLSDDFVAVRLALFPNR